MSWTQTDFPFGGATTSVINGKAVISGVQANVPADGSSSVTVTISPGFKTSMTAVVATVQESATSPLTVDATPISTTEFTLTVTGGAPNDVCSVSWAAFGE